MKTVAPLALASPQSADATGYTYWHHDTTGGMACDPANGGAVAKFVRGNMLLTNNNSTDQYVICHLQMDDLEPYVYVPIGLRVHFAAAATGGTFTCTVQIGYFINGATNLVTSLTYSKTLAAGAYGSIPWDQYSLTRNNPWDVVTINCKIPPTGKIGSIDWGQPDKPA